MNAKQFIISIDDNQLYTATICGHDCYNGLSSTNANPVKALENLLKLKEEKDNRDKEYLTNAD